MLVVCIGNELIADDAVGYEVFNLLQEMDLPSVRLEFVGVGGVALLDHLQGDEAAMIVVDAVQFGSPPGTIHQLSWDEIPAGSNRAISAHGIGIRETIEIGRIVCPEKLPGKIFLIGIEGRCFNRTREAMTPEAAVAIDTAALQVQQYLINFYRGE